MFQFKNVYIAGVSHFVEKETEVMEHRVSLLIPRCSFVPILLCYSIYLRRNSYSSDVLHLK